MNKPEIDKPTLIELFLGFGDTVMVIEPGLLGCSPQESLVLKMTDMVWSRRAVVEAIVWRKRN